MRAVLDTTVIVGALKGSGSNWRIVEQAKLRAFEVALSDELVDEYREVVHRPHLQPFLRSPAVVIPPLETLALRFPPPPRCGVWLRDPDDDPLLDLAVAAEADYLVTNNLAHFPLAVAHASGRVEIVAPGEFLARRP
jgi:putative PIN family toxin of toxin-antitoxin system